MGLVFLKLSVPAWALLSTEDEKELGRKILRQIRAQTEILEDPELTAYLKRIGDRLLKQAGPKFFQFKFLVIKENGLNAFAIPGGYIFFTSGLLEEVDSEAELAAVMAHEIAHIQLRHVARRLESLKRLQMATGAVTLAALLLGGGRAGSAAAVTSSALALTRALAYSRSDEEEADRLGMEFLTRAGYPASAFLLILNKIARHRWLLAENGPSYLLTHPAPPERLAYLETLVPKYPVSHPRSSDPIYLRRLQVRVKTQTHDPGTLVLRYREALKYSPQDPFLHYGLGMALARKRFFKEALKELQWVVKSYPQRDYFWLDLAEVYFDAGRYPEARQALEEYLKRTRRSSPKARWLLARTYQELRAYNQALGLFKALEEEFGDFPSYHYYLGQLFSSMGEEGPAHYEFGRYFALKGEFKVARYHYQKALKLLPPKDPRRQKIENKLKSWSKS